MPSVRHVGCSAALSHERTASRCPIVTWLDDLRRDRRYAVRTLARSPIFSLVAIVSLALGIGANTAMFQLLNALLLRPLPVERPPELVEVNLPESDLQVVRGNFPRYPALQSPDWERVRERQQTFATMSRGPTTGSTSRRSERCAAYLACG